MKPDGTDFSVNHILNDLNPAQLTAVTSDAPVVQILAPPGSGKTKTLTARTAYLLQHHGYKPWNVICCTFTIKAAREMQERIKKLIGHDSGSMLILGTFHSICLRYLVSYGHLIGLRNGFGIADESDSKGILKRIVKRMGLNIEPKVARSRISRQKAKGITSSDLVAKTTKNVDQQEFIQVFQEYEAALANSSLLDYDDLLLKCSELLRLHPFCVSNVEAVLVDEFQDTNTVQYNLMKSFAGQKRRITIVGDPDQSIYGFRSAEIKNLEWMREYYKDTLVVNLVENYRSSGAILRCADEMIRQEVSRQPKRLVATHCYGSLPTLRKLPSAVAEANWILVEIQRAVAMTGNMLNHSDFAVLLRSSSLSRNIESALGKAGIPYRMVGGHRFFDRYEIKVLLDYLRTVIQPQNNDAFARIINIPPRRIGDVTIKGLLEEAETEKVSLWSVIMSVTRGGKKTRTQLNKGHDQGLCSVVNVISNAKKKLAECSGTDSPLELLKHVIQKISWRKHLEEKDPENHEERWANVEELLAQAHDVSCTTEPDGEPNKLPQLADVEMQMPTGGEETLSRFLANVALSTEIRQDGNEEDHAKVTISTIHAAKGLEWPVVFIPAAYDGSIPHSRAEDHEEERRLLYVAMTRAQSLLYVSYPRRSSQQEEMVLSAFLPSKIIKGRFVDRGPIFTTQILEDISNILQRPLPAEGDISAARLQIKSVEDNLWPTYPGAEEGETWVEDPEEAKVLFDWRKSCSKMRRIGTIMNNIGSEAAREPPVTFMSASRVNVLAQTTTISQFRNTNQLTKAPAPKSETLNKKSSSDKHGKVQGTLGAFFKGSQASVAQQTPPDVLADVVPLPQLKRSIPEEFMRHQLRNGSLAKKPSLIPNHGGDNSHAFLSSSPPLVRQQRDSHEAAIERSDEHINAKAAPVIARGATTLHATTMQKLQTVRPPARKTLGVRRTFNGWADRMSKEKSI